MIKVWDPLVRILHWSLVLGIVAAWLTRQGARDAHELIGYAVLGVVILRILWGFSGTQYAQFSQFVASPVSTLKYLKQILAGTEERHVGHNPLGGWMTVALLATIALVSLSGWLYTTDEFWGVEWVAELHEVLTYFLFVLVALHLAGVAFTSYRQRENLVAAMLHGRKRT